MDNTKLPDLEKLRGVKKRVKNLPAQNSALDTSNWEGRNISVPVIDMQSKKKKIRQFDVSRIPKDDVLTSKDIEKIEQMRNKKN